MSNTKNTFVMSYRTDIRKFATIVRWLRASSLAPANKNHALKLALDLLVEVVVKNDPALEVRSTAEALGYLNDLGLVDASKGKAAKMLAQALQDESKAMGGKQLDQALTAGNQHEIKLSRADEVAAIMAKRRQQEALDQKAFAQFDLTGLTAKKGGTD